MPTERWLFLAVMLFLIAVGISFEAISQTTINVARGIAVILGFVVYHIARYGWLRRKH